MGFDCGIVGLPNAGKSTLFNSLTASRAAEAANYPFCTIEPNIGRVAVPDARLDTVARLAGSARGEPARLGFVDIAGLVHGASQGAGLGNRFLARIREVDAVVHVVRCFEDPDVSHPSGAIQVSIHANSACAGICDCTNMVEISGSMPAAMNKAALSRVFWRNSCGS